MSRYKTITILIVMIISYSLSASVNGNVELKKISSKQLNLKTILKVDGVVWSFVFIKADELLYTIRSGELHHYNIQTKKQQKLSTPKLKAKGQGGLLDVQYYSVKGKNYIYVTYSKEVKGTLTTALARSSFENGKGGYRQGEWETLFEAKVKSNTTRHFGSRLVRGGDYLYMTVGDRGMRKYAQNTTIDNGSIFRLTMGGRAKLWSYGHRNPQGIDIDPVSNRLYSCEFGPRGGDELNLIKEGKNYGWPLITYGKEYWGPSIGEFKKSGMEQPVIYWTPSISPSGMVFYTGTKTPAWKNSLFLANLSGEHLRRVVLKGNKVIKQEIILADLEERIRHVRNGADGYLYISTDSGTILRVSLK